jgi:hypothetical protein
MHSGYFICLPPWTQMRKRSPKPFSSDPWDNLSFHSAGMGVIDPSCPLPQFFLVNVWTTVAFKHLVFYY